MRRIAVLALAPLLLAALVTADPSYRRAGKLHTYGDNNATNGHAAAPQNATSTGCPPANFTTVRNFNLLAYAAAPWYVQKQLPLNYQPPDELYCVKAEYEPRNPANFSAGIIVNNYANKGAVNGPSRGSSKYDRNNGSTLLAYPATPGSNVSDAKLIVGPEALQRLLPGDAWRAAYGPYWIVAAGPSKNKTLRYDWAIISGGPPRYPSPAGGCSTIPPGVNATAAAGSYPRPAQGRPGAAGNSTSRQRNFDFGGLWFFSRKPVDPENTEKMERRAKELGLDTSQMLPVAQQGCKYAF